jgi:hypothetical protein
VEQLGLFLKIIPCIGRLFHELVDDVLASFDDRRRTHDLSENKLPPLHPIPKRQALHSDKPSIRIDLVSMWKVWKAEMRHDDHNIERLFSGYNIASLFRDVLFLEVCGSLLWCADLVNHTMHREHRTKKAGVAFRQAIDKNRLGIYVESVEVDTILLRCLEMFYF